MVNINKCPRVHISPKLIKQIRETQKQLKLIESKKIKSKRKPISFIDASHELGKYLNSLNTRKYLR